MKILIAPLNWGLGHATRCIPIIKYLLEKKCKVIIGADGRPLQLLKNEFPALEFITMPGYNISYPKSGSMAFKMVTQIPKIFSGIKREHELLKRIIIEKNINAVISDNRFGLWNKDLPCVFITHQLMVKSPFGENIIHQLNKKYISKYSECWIPDCVGENNLSGDLSHKFSLPKNAKILGLLSRFNSPSNPSAISSKKKNKLLVVLSGPEPQRTAFERKILDALAAPLISLPKEPGKILLVQGITENNDRKIISENIEIVSHLTSGELQNEILASEIILSRPGYSTIMDLAILRKKAIFVPTPGQTEQEYLGNYFLENQIAYSVSQKKFNLKTALHESEKFSGFTEQYSGEDFKKAIDDLILSLT